MRVLHAASEAEPYARTGGLGDVVGALPTALREVGVEATTVLPLHRSARRCLAADGVAAAPIGVSVEVPTGLEHVRFDVLAAERPGRAPVLFAACDPLFDRDTLYGQRDDGVRYVAFGRAVVEALPRLPGGPFDVVHAHDWHAALVPALLGTTLRASAPAARTVITLHTLAFQGVFPKDLLPIAGLPWEVFHHDAAEFFGHLSLLKAGVALADAVTTVSPTYAREILTPAFGVGLDGFLRRFHVDGILNGVDPTVWSPAVDPKIPVTYDRGHLDGKAACRAALHAEAGWAPRPETPLLGIVSRLTDQKGLDLVAALAPELDHLDARLVVVGTGEPGLEHTFTELARRHPDRVHADLVFDDALAHRVIAGADALLVPSRFEPCGLTQLYALAYGTVPVVHAVGGLADTVHDPGDEGLAQGLGTGFVFRHPTVEGLRWALGRAVATFRDAPEAWRAIQHAGMGRDHSWTHAAKEYAALYRRLLAT
jgi:starch synthase